jgi:cytochrome oxidase assembly protein ShyY1
MQAMSPHSTLLIYAFCAALILAQIGSIILARWQFKKLARKLDMIDEQMLDIGRRLEDHGRRLDRVERKSQSTSRPAA